MLADRDLTKKIGLIVLAVLMVAGALLMPRFGQPDAYHAFADQRSLFGVPRFGDVVSNLAFLIVGAFGLATLHGLRRGARALDRSSSAAATVFFLAVVLIAAGSAYYHWEPTTTRLYWDRLPMAVAFTSLLALFVIDRIDARVVRQLALPLLVLFGIACTTYWHWSEQAGEGDLRFYFLVQAACMVFVPLVVVLFPGRLTTRRHVIWIAGFYAAAIVCELMDPKILEASSGVVSGHTIKHLLAAIAIGVVAIMLRTSAKPKKHET